MKQTTVFHHGEAEKWYERNKDVLTPENDPVLHAMAACEIKPKSVLEVGCSNGWRLNAIDGAILTQGIDPMGPTTLRRGVVVKGDAASLHAFMSDEFDAVIYGWCLYLCDREDLFKIASEGDRVLKDGGYLVVHDFHPFAAYKRRYRHVDGLFSYKMDYSKLWTANPAYKLVGRYMRGDDDDRTSVSILQKNIAAGWPLHG